MEEVFLKINSLDKPARQILLKFLDALLQTRQLAGSSYSPAQAPMDVVNEAEPATYGGSQIHRFHLLDKASQALVLNFIETLLKKQVRKRPPGDPFGNKAWKKKLRDEVSVWQEEQPFEPPLAEPANIPFNYEEYRKRLLELPPWTDEEIAEFDENIAAFKNWKIEEW